ncbi:putative MPP superfamily phosphohydrolase [Allocatelliglobosispora scoriae]|uniref:Putative MPP superfamily phosphohydrolase n=1 Tax=Allocatelliglobosispora scoriae TaxID=643052 RepID=A0A841BQF1_9ACTN|nr:metallophosphoesterase [Allocatelliglobosispora scoriae]MBB5869925.1 putative MPP superfamily phosphohydrolase [Allocatelliglobosispora scoriae]
MRVRWLSSAVWTGHPRIGRALALLAVTIAGVVIGVLLGGHTSSDVGPFRATMTITPTLTGDTEVDIPPLGALLLDSHDGPAHLTVRLDALDRARTQALITDPAGISRASQNAVTDVSSGLVRLVLKTTGMAVVCTMILAALIFRRIRQVAITGLLAVAVVGATVGSAALTLHRDALSQPRYDGLLAYAPTVVGDAKKIADNYGAYADQLQKMVGNVSKLYASVSRLPVFEPAPGTTRVLHISDMHLNPTAWEVVRTVVEQFQIDVVVDTGDITDWGSQPERNYVASIALLGVPYVFVRGNHDSEATALAVAGQPNAIVLENGIVTVGGITFAGIGDPRFTPDKQSNASDSIDSEETIDEVTGVGKQLAETIDKQLTKINVALVHDPLSAEPLIGHCPLILAGHRHERSVTTKTNADGKTSMVMVQGSTGGAGLRGLESAEPLPLAMSVLYFDDQHTLQAYDDIRVGGTGLAQVSLERKLVLPPVLATPTPTATR